MIERFVRLESGEGDEHTWRVRVPADSAFFDGHFPDRPILPAVTELALVEELARETLGTECSIHEIPSMRFRSPVGPGEELSLSLGARESDGGRAITLRRGSEIVARGKLVFRGDG